MHAISELFELSRPFVTHTPHTATLLRLTIILVPTAVLLALAVPAAKERRQRPARLAARLVRRAFGADYPASVHHRSRVRCGHRRVFGQQPSITAELGFPWNADLLALGLFWSPPSTPTS